ncbi:DNA cytosine methyltransferase [Bradyrhizobium sp. LHD-71]|uniref:DNA cytosine methyltransferase n=1 Tax=Bradyrhizobium sp. LHD-71 TaxID=3072141 RepID=UPI00280E1BFB|nr:DNA cytosine methyltransferase [Bradyrhizobium sp. LHD-71]MDQ8727390.1 DNA cytosine methyltransferase [Bradyrhizobium sp. LHD-71]
MGARKRTAISLYTGVGGLDFGFEAAGFDTVAAVELDAASCRAVRLNRPKWGLMEGDIHDITSERILATAGLEPGEADVLIGGPPCQPFSKSSYWVNGDALRLDDPRADTLTAYLRVLRDVRPKAFLLENVYGLVYKGKDEGLRHLLTGIEQINRETGTNYTVSWKMLNAAHYGVPQNRERVFLIGSRDGASFQFPAATHCSAEEHSLLDDREPYRTAWDAIGDLPRLPNEPSLEVGGKWGDLLPTIPEGQNYLWHTNRGGGAQLFGWRTRYWSFLLKLAKDQPSWTIQAQPGSAIGPFHWMNRKLSVQEMCRLQTFPDGLSFECGRTDVQRMLGNAVPSLLAEVLAREIRRQLLGDKKSLGALKLIAPVRHPVPAPERLARLPAKYKSLIADHADHPGEGRLQARKKQAKEAETLPLLPAAAE